MPGRRLRARGDGLRQSEKRIPCKYLYDERGSKLFDRICELEEYYPTRTELQIMERWVGEMASAIGPRSMLIEYGSGSGLKTRELLDALEDPAVYVPIDISHTHLAASAADLRRRYPEIEVLPLCADYTEDYELPDPRRDPRRRVVYFPGSTIGNFDHDEARDFLEHIIDVCGEDGGLLIGVDLKKDPAIIERAYNDRAGITAEFNLNMLRRINRELDGNLRLDRFRHLAIYDARRGRIEMHLVSLCDQRASIDGERVDFADGETIHTENSHKYTLEEFRELAASAGLAVRRTWVDEADLFSVQYLEVD